MRRFRVVSRTGVDRVYTVEADGRDAAWGYVARHHGQLIPIQVIEYADQVYRAARDQWTDNVLDSVTGTDTHAGGPEGESGDLDGREAT